MEKIERRSSVTDLKDIAYRACQHTSFSPEKRGETLMDDLEIELRRFQELIPVEMHTEYERKYIDLYRNWLSAKSRCISSMITGPANFPTRRAEKYNNWERSAREKLDSWAQRVVNRLNKKDRLTGWEEIERLRNKVEMLETAHENMKAANGIMRNKSLSIGEKKEELSSIGFKDSLINEIFKACEGGGVAFERFQLTNNLATINTTKERLTRLENIANTQDKRTEYDWGILEMCYSEERIRLHFNEKPDQEMITKLKKSAFKWSPKNKAWQRQITQNAIYATKKLLEIEAI